MTKKMIFSKNRKGISPLIATVLLIGFTIVMAAVVMKWGGSLVKKTIEDTDCESKGVLTCTSHIDISVGNIEYTDTSSTITKLTVNNLAATQSLEGFNVQREFTDGSVENKQVLFSLDAGNTADIAPSTNDIDFNNPVSGQSLKSIHVSPIFQQATSDGRSCRIICTEQKITVPATDPRFTTTIPSDTTPPYITNVQASSTLQNLATITWTTNETSSSVVYYHKSSEFFYTGPVTGPDGISHSVDLSGLQEDTLYNYKVNSTDPSGNSAESSGYSFTTCGSLTPCGIP